MERNYQHFHPNCKVLRGKNKQGRLGMVEEWGIMKKNSSSSINPNKCLKLTKAKIPKKFSEKIVKEKDLIGKQNLDNKKLHKKSIISITPKKNSLFCQPPKTYPPVTTNLNTSPILSIGYPPDPSSNFHLQPPTLTPKTPHFPLSSTHFHSSQSSKRVFPPAPSQISLPGQSEFQKYLSDTYLDHGKGQFQKFLKTLNFGLKAPKKVMQRRRINSKTPQIKTIRTRNPNFHHNKHSSPFFSQERLSSPNLKL
ncbi:unnamed protein product [Moneuplotes crassus]|uniref:Uncharacterized protein n=1 Tax=Euplotes crassus TaxID=5936 RepID=A0AAD2DAB3_EUPCR|nr:unnamed protein product [Moneuplotes crassus]